MALTPDERALRDHIAGPRFVDGLERGKWRIIADIAWPYVLVAVSVAPRDNAPPRVLLARQRGRLPGVSTDADALGPGDRRCPGSGLQTEGSSRCGRVSQRLEERDSSLRSLRSCGAEGPFKVASETPAPCLACGKGPCLGSAVPARPAE